MGAFSNDPMWSAFFGKLDGPAVEAGPPVVAMSQLPAVRYGWDTGDKFPGGIGAVNLLWPDYWTLRQRSAELYERNLYARGLIRRLVTNEINTGLHLEATPEELLLGLGEDSLSDWSEEVENRFSLWAKDRELCDHDERWTFGKLQKLTRMEALVSGDVLVVLRQDQRTRAPRLQLICGGSVQTPFGEKPRNGNKITHGVEIDAQGRHVAYWVRQEETSGGQIVSKRLPAFGEKSGRRLAWLVYGSDKRLDDVRGKPLLALVLQSLYEIDRYRDSTQRKALINSFLAMFVTKTQEKPGSRALGGGAVRKGTDVAIDTSGQPRTFRTAEMIPGVVLDELQHGEEPKAFSSTGVVEPFPDFEKAIVSAIAWANGVPPEILVLSFSNNYSASQAAINEFKLTLNDTRTEFGENFCQPIYVEWLVAEVLAGRIAANGLLESWRSWALFDRFAAWTSADWTGQIKPAVDLSKLVGGHTEMCEQGFSTRDRSTRELTGTKFSKNAKKLKREHTLLAEAMQPLIEMKQKLKAAESGAAAPAPKGEPANEPDDQQDDDERDDTEDQEETDDVAAKTGSRRGAAPRLEARGPINGHAARGVPPEA